jgi:hypothetical protein
VENSYTAKALRKYMEKRNQKSGGR